MAPYIKFSVPLVFAVVGLWAFVVWPLWLGLIVFVAVFFIGSCLGTYLFKRYATPDQVREDLEARLHND